MTLDKVQYTATRGRDGASGSAGVKGLGAVSIVGLAAAIANAIHHATA
jgi:CO/xanthine dehydrogenase Mo-binding subunit